MGRRRVNVDKDKFIRCVKKAEENGPLKNISELTQNVSLLYNALDVNEKITSSVVYTRLKEFDVETKTKPERKRKSRENVCKDYIRPGGPLKVHAPAGQCPVKLRGTDRETVIQWAESVMDAGYKTNREFTVHAVKYFVRQFYKIGSREWNTVIGIIKDEYENEDIIS